MARDFPEQTWLVDRLIPASSITILSAEPSSFKTYLLLETALKVARGEPLFGKFDTQKVGTLILDEDSGDRQLHSRLKELRASGDLPIHLYMREGFKLNEACVSRVLLECRTFDLKLIMIDCLVRVHSADENVAQDMAAVFKQLNRFTAEGLTVVITHHNRKPGTGRGNSRYEMRGSSDILAAVDCHIALKRDRDDDHITVEQTKTRYGKELPAFVVQVVDDSGNFVFKHLGSNADTKSRKLRMAIHDILGAHGKQYQKEILGQLKKSGTDVNQRTLSKTLKAMVADGQVSSDKGKGNTQYFYLPEPTPEAEG